MKSLVPRFLIAATLVAASGALAGATAIAAGAAAPVQPEASPEYRKIIDAAGDALVTVKFVLKSTDDQGFGDSEQEINGIVIDPKGVVLVSHWSMGGAFSMFGASGPKPQDVRVLIGDDIEGKKARLVSHDTELDLAWVQLDEAPETPLKHLDINGTAAAAMGDRIFLLSRLDKYFDRAMVINEGRVRGVTTKPRRLYVPSRDLLTDLGDLGMPVFNQEAALVGFVVVQIPDEESREAAQDLGGGPMIMPVEEVAKATKRAMEALSDPAATPEPPKADEKPAEPPPAEPR